MLRTLIFIYLNTDFISKCELTTMTGIIEFSPKRLENIMFDLKMDILTFEND